MNTTTKALIAIALITFLAATFLFGTAAFIDGAYCGWPEWTKVGMASRVWGVCK